MAYQYGNVVYPVDVDASATTLLPVCDPALAKVLDFLKFCITKYAGDAITAMVALPATDDSSISMQAAIAQVVPIDPETIAKAEQFQFPLFCGWPKSVQYNHKSLNWICDVRRVGLAYIFPPFTPTQSILWSPALNSISQVCNAAIKAGFDVDYNSGERIFADNNITSCRLLSADFGSFDFGGNAKPPYFPAWMAELEISEQQRPYTVGLTNFEGIDLEVAQQAGDDVSTTVTANAAIGATTIQVASTEGFEVLDVAIFGFGTARQETASITAIPDATHLTIAAPGLVFAHTAVQADTVKRHPVTIVSAKSDVG